MKNKFKLFVNILLALIIFSACSSVKNTTQTASKNDVQGTWLLNNVTYESAANERVKINLFDDADITCFSSSNWVLPHNGYGSYTITQNGAGCNSGPRNIIWSLENDNGESVFQFKRLTEGEKAKNISEGYKLKIISATNDNLSMQSQIDIAGGTLLLTYNFTRQ